MKIAFCLVLLALVAAASAGKQNDTPLSQNSSGDTLRVVPRQKNPGPISNFEELYKRHKNTCLCEGRNCLCCAKVQGLNYRSCIGYHKLRGKFVKVSVVFEGLTVLSDKFSLTSRTQVCTKLPAQQLGVHFCLIQNNKPTEDGGIKTCTGIGFKVSSEGRMASIHVKCLIVKKSGLSVSADKEDYPGVLEYKRNVHFEGVINRLKNKQA